MKKNSTHLFNILKKLQSSSLDRKELNYLIDKSYKISFSFIRSKQGLKLNNYIDEITSLEDLAMDAIVPLFVKNSAGELGIHRSLINWNDSLNTESDADYFLSRIIWCRAEQAITDLFKERDPIFEKILKTLNFCISKCNYVKKKYFGTTYVVESEDTKLENNLINEENFDLIPESYFGNKQKKLFDIVFDYLKNETNYCPAIPLNKLVKRVKYFYVSHEIVSLHKIDHTEQEISINEILKGSLCDIREKIDVYYVKNNKINDEDADLLYAAFDDISKDISIGGMNNSLYSYAKLHKKTLSKEEFYSRYHHIMNYLFKRFKNNIVKEITVE